MRDNEAFRRKIREEKLNRAGKCVFEYMAPGSCSKGSHCTFGHIISEEEKNNLEMRRKMEEIWAKLGANRSRKPAALKQKRMTEKVNYGNGQQAEMGLLAAMVAEHLKEFFNKKDT